MNYNNTSFVIFIHIFLYILITATISLSGCLYQHSSLSSNLDVGGGGGEGVAPAGATRDLRFVLLINSQNKFNLLSCLLIYLFNKYSL